MKYCLYEIKMENDAYRIIRLDAEGKHPNYGSLYRSPRALVSFIETHFLNRVPLSRINYMAVKENPDFKQRLDEMVKRHTNKKGLEGKI